MWIDPLEVSYRIGENGSICVLYEHKASKKETTTDPSLAHHQLEKYFQDEVAVLKKHLFEFL